MNHELAKSLLDAYATKSARAGQPKSKANPIPPEVRLVLQLMVFDGKPGWWGYELLVENGALPPEPADEKEKKSQIRKINGWCARVRSEMGLPPLTKGGQTRAQLEARRRWDDLNPRPGYEELLAGKWQGIAADYSGLDLSASSNQRKSKSPKAAAIENPVPLPPAVPPAASAAQVPRVAAAPRSTQPEATKHADTGPAGGESQRPAEITRRLKKLPRDEHYPEAAVRLMTLRHTIAMGQPPTKEDVRDWYPGIAREMKGVGIQWAPPAT